MKGLGRGQRLRDADVRPLAAEKPRRIADGNSGDVRKIVHGVVVKIQRCADRCAFALSRDYVENAMKINGSG